MDILNIGPEGQIEADVFAKSVGNPLTAGTASNRYALAEMADRAFFSHAALFAWLNTDVDPLADFCARRTGIDLQLHFTDRPLFDGHGVVYSQHRSWDHALLSVPREQWPLVRDYFVLVKMRANGHLYDCSWVEATVPDERAVSKGLLLRHGVGYLQFSISGSEFVCFGLPLRKPADLQPQIVMPDPAGIAK